MISRNLLATRNGRLAAFGILYVSLLLLAILCFTVLFLRDPGLAERAAAGAGRFWSALLGNLKTFMQELGAGLFRSGVGPVAGVVFALLPMGAMALSGAVSSTLQVDLGMSDGQIAQLNIYQTILSAIGSVVGGWFADRYGQRRTLAIWYILTTLPTLYLAFIISSAQGIEGIAIGQYFTASLVFSLCMGLHYGTSAAVFMGLTNPLVAATQFTGCMALKNLAISYTNMWQGAVADSFGYAMLLYLDAALVLLPLLLIPLLKPSSRQSPEPPSPVAPLPEAG